jgi:hypothetical protein
LGGKIFRYIRSIRRFWSLETPLDHVFSDTGVAAPAVEDGFDLIAHAILRIFVLLIIIGFFVLCNVSKRNVMVIRGKAKEIKDFSQQPENIRHSNRFY